MEWLSWIIVGAIAGWLAGYLVKGDEGLGVIGHIAARFGRCTPRRVGCRSPDRQRSDGWRVRHQHDCDRRHWRGRVGAAWQHGHGPSTWRVWHGLAPRYRQHGCAATIERPASPRRRAFSCQSVGTIERDARAADRTPHHRGRRRRPDSHPQSAQALNALNAELRAGLFTAFKSASRDDATRAVVLTGAGRGFCAGADLRGGDAERDFRGVLTAEDNPLIEAIRALSKPVVAAVNGVAAGAGFSLAVAADLVVAAAEARFVPAFDRIGLVPDSGLARTLVRAGGKAPGIRDPRGR